MKAVKKELTERQLDCLFYLVQGMTIREIAEILSLSARTVEHYLEAVKAKLGCKNRSQLIAKAFKMDIIRDKINLLAKS